MTITYNKICNASVLHEQLVSAGFIVQGVSCMGDKTIVYLSDTETKDPTPIVETHLYKPEPTPEEQRISDLELTLADQIAENAELNARVSDTELVIADLLAAQ